MTSDPRSDVTTILQGMSRDGLSPEASAQLFPLVYGELRRLAGGYLRRERPNHTLQATEVVHEAYLKLVDHAAVAWQSRGHFFAVAGRAMRQILVDHARKRGRDKRGRGQPHVTLHDDVMGRARPAEYGLEDLIALHDALTTLEQLDPRQARVVEMRCFAGLTVDEVANVLGVSPRTVEGDWTHARAWLRRSMTTGRVGGRVSTRGRR